MRELGHINLTTFILIYTVHLHRKFLNKKGIKMYSAEEEAQWKTTVKKLNSHIRYLRRKQELEQ